MRGKCTRRQRCLFFCHLSSVNDSRQSTSENVALNQLDTVYSYLETSDYIQLIIYKSYSKHNILYPSRQYWGSAYLAEEVKLLIQWGADLHQSSWAGLRLVWADCSDPDVAQISNIQCAIGGHGQRGGGFKASIAGIASVSWQSHKKKWFQWWQTLNHEQNTSK